MILIVLGAILTVLALFLLIEINRVNRVAVTEVVLATAWSKRFSRQDLEDQKEKYITHNEKYHTVSEKKEAKKTAQWEKQIEEYQKQEERYMKGRCFSIPDQIAVFGYQLLVKLRLDGNSDMVRHLTKACEVSGYVDLDYSKETNGKKNASVYAFYLMACCIGYVYVGVLLALFLVILMTVMGRSASNIMMFAVVGLMLPAVFGIIPITSLQDKSAKRQEEIDMDFANVLSKMALLAMTGMNVVNIAEEAAYSGESIIYLELRKTVSAIHQSDTLAKAFADLQHRCDNRYLDKLVPLVSKSYSAGNFKLDEDLRAINDECWLDKKHQSRRMAEKIQNKLFIPTMLMFIGILVVILVPAMSGMSLF